jgi:chromosome segregation protein
LQGEAREIEVLLLTREFRILRQTLQEVESEVLNLDQQESEKAAEQARLTTELEQARLDAIATADSIGKIREELAGVEQQQAHALTAAAVERNRGELFSQQQDQESAELEELVRKQEQMAGTLQAIEYSLVNHEEDVTLRNQYLEELEQ